MNKIAEQKKERITWIDVSRGVAFMMVIYSHLEYCNDSIMKYFSPRSSSFRATCSKKDSLLKLSLNNAREHYCCRYSFLDQYKF
jgi:hypothetical protein